MKKHNFANLPLDELWRLHEEILTVLEDRVEQEKRDLEQRIEVLALRTRGDRRMDRSHARRPYPKVPPKFRHPHDASITWSGRGKQPRWVREVLADGKDLKEIMI